MEHQTAVVILFELIIVYWWLWLFYARTKAAAARAAENKKYAAWDAAFKKSVWDGKGQYQATVDAVKAINARPDVVLKVWNDVHNRLIEKGVREYTAGAKASAAAREAAHK